MGCSYSLPAVSVYDSTIQACITLFRHKAGRMEIRLNARGWRGLLYFLILIGGFYEANLFDMYDYYFILTTCILFVGREQFTKEFLDDG